MFDELVFFSAKHGQASSIESLWKAYVFIEKDRGGYEQKMEERERVGERQRENIRKFNKLQHHQQPPTTTKV